MFASVVKKTFDIYTYPARLAYRQTRRNLAAMQQFRDNIRQSQAQSNLVRDHIISQLSRQMGIDLDNLSQEQRRHKIQSALANVEYGLSMALNEGTKALILLATKQPDPADKRPGGTITGETIEGYCENISPNKPL